MLNECYNTITKIFDLYFSSNAKRNNELLNRYTVSLVIDDIRGFDIPYFTWKYDGMRDLSNTENIAIDIRYLKKSQVSGKHSCNANYPKVSCYLKITVAKVYISKQNMMTQLYSLRFLRAVQETFPNV